MGDSGEVPGSAWKDLFVAAQSLTSEVPGEAKAMSEEDRHFLEAAMSEVVHKSDPVRQMMEHINELQEIKNPSDDDVGRMEAIIDALEIIVCQIDCAVDFCKLGGVRELERLMACKSVPIRMEALRLLPTVAQNNDKAQDLLLKTDLLPSLVALVTSTEENPKIRASALSCISALVRGHDVAYSAFRRLNGFPLIFDAFTRAIEGQEDRVYGKAAITLTNIAHDLGYQASLDHGLPSMLIRMFGQLPSTSHASSYVREYINENIQLDKIDDENRGIILTALERNLKDERDGEEPDEVTIRDIESMMAKLSAKQ